MAGLVSHPRCPGPAGQGILISRSPRPSEQFSVPEPDATGAANGSSHSQVSRLTGMGRPGVQHGRCSGRRWRLRPARRHHVVHPQGLPMRLPGQHPNVPASCDLVRVAGPVKSGRGRLARRRLGPGACTLLLSLAATVGGAGAECSRCAVRRLAGQPRRAVVRTLVLRRRPRQGQGLDRRRLRRGRPAAPGRGLPAGGPGAGRRHAGGHPDTRTWLLHLSRPGPVSRRGAACGQRVDGHRSEAGRIHALFGSGGVWALLAAFFGFGILLAFTPCMLPMVPILSGIVAGHGAAVTASARSGCRRCTSWAWRWRTRSPA